MLPCSIPAWRALARLLSRSPPAPRLPKPDRPHTGAAHGRSQRNESARHAKLPGRHDRLGKLDQLPKDVPQGITIISDKLLFETNADTLKDAVRHVSA